MATGDSRIAIFVDRLLSKTALGDQFFDYLNDKIDQALSALFQGQDGTLSSGQVDLTSTANDTITLDLSAANEGIVEGGQVITLSAVAFWTDEVPFENATGVDYYVGVPYASTPSEVGLNPRKGNPEYLAYQDTWGMVGNPDSVTDVPNVEISLVVDDLTEAGVTHAGRLARVWLATPQSGEETVAFWEGSVVWDGSNNVLEIPYTNPDGPLGQDTSTLPPSTNAGDYEIHIYGPRISRNTDLRPDNEYWFLGTVTGNGPSSTPVVFDTSDQFSVFLITLDAAYDGIGSGGGRIINVDSGPIESRIYSSGVLNPSTEKGAEWKGNADFVDMRVNSLGRVARTQLFFDDFHYNSDVWTAKATGTPGAYVVKDHGDPASDARQKVENTAPDIAQASGLAEIICGGGSGSACSLEGPAIRMVPRRPGFFVRGAVAQVTDYVGYVHCRVLPRRPTYPSPGSLPAFGFYILNGDCRGYYDNGSGPVTTPVLFTFSTNTLVNMYCVADSATQLTFWADGMGSPVTLAAPINFDTGSFANTHWFPEVFLTPQAGAVHSTLTFWLDTWEVWGRKGLVDVA